MNIWQTLPRPFSILAPMEDVTDSAFRRLIAYCGAPDIFYTEFTSADGICSEGFEGVRHRLLYTEAERPLIAQIWGNTPDHYYKTAALLSDMGFDGIDINMGCPVPKVTKKGCCSALIETPQLAKELYLAAREGAPNLPVSIKTRIGYRNDKTEEWSAFLLALAPAALIIHGRIAKHLSKYPADWNAIARVVQLRNEMQSPTLIVGNGDVESHAEILTKHEVSGVDGVMVGRGIFKNPYLFNTTLPIDYMQQLPAPAKLALLLLHARLFDDTWQARKPFAVLKKYFKIYVANFSGASELRAELMETNNTPELTRTVHAWITKQGLSSVDLTTTL